MCSVADVALEKWIRWIRKGEELTNASFYKLAEQQISQNCLFSSRDCFLFISPHSSPKPASPTIGWRETVILIVPVVGFGKATSFNAVLKPKVGLLESINDFISVF